MLAHRSKVQDLINNETIAITPPTAQKMGTNLLLAIRSDPRGPRKYGFTEEFPINPSKLIAPSGTTICVCIMESNVALIPLFNYSQPIHLS